MIEVLEKYVCWKCKTIVDEVRVISPFEEQLSKLDNIILKECESKNFYEVKICPKCENALKEKHKMRLLLKGEEI